ncbi:MAG: RNA methyltransferase [Bacteroidales bacterium]|nr:RNA methyltransferase [Bacteroidales bacterium]MDT8430792.1 RNA methyltransferase [Bacteroidales bacterium]
MRKLLNEELHRMEVEAFKTAAKIPVVIVLDNVRSMNNTGSVFRTSDAFRVESVFLCGITAVPPHKEIHKTALGATESVDWQYFLHTGDALVQLRKNGYTVCSIEQAEQSIMLDSFPVEEGGKYALVFGHEIRGVEQAIVDMSDYCIEIPQYGTKHSLNVSVSAGIVIWEFFRKLSATIG